MFLKMFKSEEPDGLFLHTSNLPSSSISIWTCRTDMQGWVVRVTCPRLDVSFRNPFSLSLNTVLIVLHFTVHCQHEAYRSKKPFCLRDILFPHVALHPLSTVSTGTGFPGISTLSTYRCTAATVWTDGITHWEGAHPNCLGKCLHAGVQK